MPRDKEAQRVLDQNRRNKEKEAREAICLKLKEKRELDKQAAQAMPILTPSPSATFEIGAYVRAIADTTLGMHPKHSEDVRGQVTQVDIEGGRTRIQSNGTFAYTSFDLDQFINDI